MQVRALKGHQQAVVIRLDNIEVLFSYCTPVAVHLDNLGYYKTEKFWSNTTSKHVAEWLRQCKTGAVEIPQEHIQGIVDGIRYCYK